LQHSLDDVVKLRPVSFNFKAGGAASMGVIAQELEQVYPQLVKDDGDTKYVNYNGLFGPLIGAIQDLKQENDTLRKELDQQKAQINKLQKETKYGRGAATN
jgi:cell division protein FtsB